MALSLLPETALAAGEEDTPINERVNETPEYPFDPVYYIMEERQIRFLDSKNAHGDNPSGTKPLRLLPIQTRRTRSSSPAL